MEIECLDFAQDEFTQRFNGREQDVLSFYEELSYDAESLKEVWERPAHPHTEALADIIEEEMARYGLSGAQRENLERLRQGSRVVIGGQQAGLFMSPSYIVHKIITLLVMVEEVRESHGYQAVPVFWIAGEDHDFDEVNHTHVYDQAHRRRRKIAYKPNLTVPMSLGFYKYDRGDMKATLDAVVEECGDSGFLRSRKVAIMEMIDTHEYWTELFHALVHDVFSEEGLIIFNAHSSAVRRLEVPMFKEMLERHDEIDQAFRSGQAAFGAACSLPPMIETDTNVHLFTGSEENRTLLVHNADGFATDKGVVSKDELLARLEEAPETFSNNVVTRPLMQEMLFNTLIFAGGGAEVKYWGELHEAFRKMEVPMPIVVKRMEILHEDMRLRKLMDKYDLQVSHRLHEDVERKKKELLDDATDASFLKEVDDMQARLESDYDAVGAASERTPRHLIEANLKAHRKQFDYLKRRYQLEVRRTLRHQLNDLEEVAERILPGGNLQERIYHPWMFPEIDPSTLSYTTQLTIIKGV
ncbi:bacillithiol biosynthesis cysteine-adding enzyme BshC [Salinicoccus roseus]|uniref:bacillithiol biosynthesis cysteine-adding enzyme BshC n=1 Tax=Salinicoccus roseus TaxID=45670 RepID=UPI003563BAF9